MCQGQMRTMSPLMVLLLQVSAVYSDSHSLRYYKTGVSAPGSGLHEFSIVGYVDDREIVNYNSDTRRVQPKVQWMEKMEAEYWEVETQIGKEWEAFFKHNVRTVMSLFNQTEGFHVYQVMYACEQEDDGSITGYYQDGYDGKEFLALDTRTSTFVATMAQAQITTQKWNSLDVHKGERYKNFLDNYCIELLKKHVEDGREDLERRVRPRVKVSGQEKGDAMKLHCQVYGFHPRPVDVKWIKNGEDEVHAYETTHILPNPDGTYQIRVSTEVTPKDGDSYSCYVDHSSLEDPLLVRWEPKTSSVGLIVVAIAGVVIALAGVIGVLVYKKKQVFYKEANSDAMENSSPQKTKRDLVAFGNKPLLIC